MYNIEQLSEYCETLASIENIMISNPNHKFILLMDLNCDIFNPRNAYSELIIDLISSRVLNFYLILIPKMPLMIVFGTEQSLLEICSFEKNI